MKLDRIKDVAKAVLYEGYILYPYRPSAIKNRQRWTFGGVFPQAFAGRQGDAGAMQTEVLLRGTEPWVDIHVCFLQIVERGVGRIDTGEGGAPTLTMVPRLTVDGRDLLAWEEAIEREVVLAARSCADPRNEDAAQPFRFNAVRTEEPVQARDGTLAAMLVRTSETIEGVIRVRASPVAPQLWRLAVVIDNVTLMPRGAEDDRSAAQARAFVSTHTILCARTGQFVSLLDPPADARDAAAACNNIGTYPVLVGSEGATDAVLSSPIILYDYPNIAPESPGDLFDGTEIDEILTLRILAMTDTEKREMAAVDARARALLERTHGLTADDMAQLHGTMRNRPAAQPPPEARPAAAAGKPRLVSLLSNGRDLVVGTQVRLRPKAGGDIMDMALRDKIAVIEAIERDFEDRVHVAVTLLDDPGRDLGAAGFPGHRFFFAQDEIEPVGDGA
jgi:hypothetical protein